MSNEILNKVYLVLDSLAVIGVVAVLIYLFKSQEEIKNKIVKSVVALAMLAFYFYTNDYPSNELPNPQVGYNIEIRGVVIGQNKFTSGVVSLRDKAGILKEIFFLEDQILFKKQFKGGSIAKIEQRKVVGVYIFKDTILEGKRFSGKSLLTFDANGNVVSEEEVDAHYKWKTVADEVGLDLKANFLNK